MMIKLGYFICLKHLLFQDIFNSYANSFHNCCNCTHVDFGLYFGMDFRIHVKKDCIDKPLQIIKVYL